MPPKNRRLAQIAAHRRDTLQSAWRASGIRDLVVGTALRSCASQLVLQFQEALRPPTPRGLAPPASQAYSRALPAEKRPETAPCTLRIDLCHSSTVPISYQASSPLPIAMFQFYASDGPKSSQEAGEIERYRARHRRLCRGKTPDSTSRPQVEDLDVEDGRTRKISAKWRQQQQQQVPVSNQFDDANWAEAEMLGGFNAFDFSSSPEAFGETEQQLESKAPCNQQQQHEEEREGVTGSLWERRCQALQQPDGTARQLPTLRQDALWGGPVHYATHDAQRRVLYYQPQYYA